MLRQKKLPLCFRPVVVHADPIVADAVANLKDADAAHQAVTAKQIIENKYGKGKENSLPLCAYG